MIVIDNDLLKRLRGPGRCELCGKWCDTRQVHHIFSRGQGGGQRLDVEINLLSLGAGFACRCHDLCHWGSVPRHAQLCVVALREGMEVEEVVAEIYRLRRLTKRGAA